MQVQVYIGLGLHCIDVLIYLQYFFLISFENIFKILFYFVF